jgi:hypothetical protein
VSGLIGVDDDTLASKWFLEGKLKENKWVG